MINLSGKVPLERPSSRATRRTTCRGKTPTCRRPGPPGRRGADPSRPRRGRGTSHAGRPESTAQVRFRDCSEASRRHRARVRVRPYDRCCRRTAPLRRLDVHRARRVPWRRVAHHAQWADPRCSRAGETTCIHIVHGPMALDAPPPVRRRVLRPSTRRVMVSRSEPVRPQAISPARYAAAAGEGEGRQGHSHHRIGGTS